MTTLFRELFHDEHGFIVSAELAVISTLLVVGLITGLRAIQESAVGELSELAGAVRSLDQSYSIGGRRARGRGITVWTAGSYYPDRRDDEATRVDERSTVGVVSPDCSAGCDSPAPCGSCSWVDPCGTGCCPSAWYDRCATGCGPCNIWGSWVGSGCRDCSLPIPCACDPIPVLPPPAPCPVIDACSTCPTTGCGLPGEELARTLRPLPACRPCAPTDSVVIW